MKFYFNMRDEDLKPENETYWNEKTIRMIRIYPATNKLDNEWLTNEFSSLWPVYDACEYSTEFVECKDKDAAYDELLNALNTSIYERINDI